MNEQQTDSASPMHDISSHSTPIYTEPRPVAARWSLLGIGLAVLLASATFFSGFHLGSGTKLEASVGSWFIGNTLQHEASSETLGEFWHVWELLEKKFVSATSSDEVSQDEKVWGAIRGLVDSYGDPYTVYLPPEDAEMFDEDISGNFSGVGMEVGIRDDVLTIIAPLPDTPAEAAGLLAGDIIVKIDDVVTDGMSIDEAVRRIRGEQGTEVYLTIYREGDTEFTEVTVTRDTISIPTSKTEMRDDVFIISLYSFNALAEMEMQLALREYVQSGASNLILDLRGNPGGFLQSAVAIASYFLPTGTVIVRESLGDGLGEDTYRSSGRMLGAFTPKEVVVLIDGGSASASEILAGALREHGVATLVGEQTFGKGSVQELVELNDGSSLKVTVARWLTPEGISISEAGLTPDIVVERTPEDRMEDRDPQLDAAVDFLRRE